MLDVFAITLYYVFKATPPFADTSFKKRLWRFCHTVTIAFLARDSMLSELYAVARPSVRLSVTRVDQSKTVEARIMQFSPYSSPIPLVFAG